MSDPLQCYNISCGKTYQEIENNDQACQYHPGKPYFHDGYKEWTCCKMRSRDFSVFMSFKGCKYLLLQLFNQFIAGIKGTKGRHSNVKPEEPSKPAVIESNSDCSSTVNQNDNNNVNKKSNEPSFIPPDADHEQEIEIFESPKVATAPPVPKTIIICKNCKKEESTLNMAGPCLYHKGVQM